MESLNPTRLSIGKKNPGVQILLDQIFLTDPLYKKDDKNFDVFLTNSKITDEEIYDFLRQEPKIINRYPNVIDLARKD